MCIGNKYEFWNVNYLYSGVIQQISVKRQHAQTIYTGPMIQLRLNDQ